MSRLMFGKYKGRSIDDMLHDLKDQEYLAWAYDNYKFMREDQRKEIANKLGIPYGPKALPIIGKKNKAKMYESRDHSVDNDDIPF